MALWSRDAALRKSPVAGAMTGVMTPPTGRKWAHLGAWWCQAAGGENYPICLEMASFKGVLAVSPSATMSP
jgi:hypothetical protein